MGFKFLKTLKYAEGQMFHLIHEKSQSIYTLFLETLQKITLILSLGVKSATVFRFVELLSTSLQLARLIAVTFLHFCANEINVFSLSSPLIFPRVPSCSVAVTLWR